MPRVKIDVELSDLEYRHYQDEARSRGDSVQSLVQQMVRGLIDELRQDEREGTDHLIIPS